VNYYARNLGWRTLGKWSLEWSRNRWEDNIKVGLRETGREDERFMEQDQNRVKWRAVVLEFWTFGFYCQKNSQSDTGSG
jgi:hypothetical protein